MPELPEVETLRRSLEPALLGHTVRRVRVHRRDVVVGEGDPVGGWSRSPLKTPPVRLSGAMLLAGARIEQILRLGKRLAIVASDGRTIEIHLGMSGQLLVVSPGARLAQNNHVHLRWFLDSGDRLVFRDPRRFGGVWIHSSEQALHKNSWARIGPDALRIGTSDLRKRAEHSSRAIKAVLLDQRVLAGVGNIYADEALFRARISPLREARSINPQEWRVLAGSIRAVLTRAVRARGTTLRDYRDARGQRGSAGLTLRVYGRGGLPCDRCQTKLVRESIAQRTTTWCPICQARSMEE